MTTADKPTKGPVNEWEIIPGKSRGRRAGDYALRGICEGREVFSSSVFSVDFMKNVVETENSIYMLGTPKG